MITGACDNGQLVGTKPLGLTAIETKRSEEGSREGAVGDGAVINERRDPHTKTTSRNLRIREDTAKYLRNLDVNSAYYGTSLTHARYLPIQTMVCLCVCVCVDRSKVAFDA